ncbi:hypothetical protein CAPGI0001_2013 [Capnocytophaga gingivalis ATCC 33624]|nr:hypothetical protein CAPGI0001_2013 [Capnocytophaga gingivalis ATCC 33624]
MGDSLLFFSKRMKSEKCTQENTHCFSFFSLRSSFFCKTT